MITNGRITMCYRQSIEYCNNFLKTEYRIFVKGVSRGKIDLGITPRRSRGVYLGQSFRVGWGRGTYSIAITDIDLDAC